MRLPSVLLIVFLVAACSVAGSPVALTVGIKFDQPGVGLRTPEGTFEGLDVDVARYVANALGVQDVRFVEARSADRENLIEQGAVDLVVASYSITDKRKQRVDFAGPYFIAGQSLLVRRKNADIAGPESLDFHDWRLCSVAGSTSAEKVRNHYARHVTLQELSSYRECVDALDRGEVDAVSTDDVILAGFAALEPQRFKLVGAPFSMERYGIGLRKGDPRRSRVTAALRQMFADGSWQRAVDANLGRSGFRVALRPSVDENP